MIALSPAAAAVMRQAAAEAYPEECCGLLVGWTTSRGTIVIDEAIACANVAAVDRRRRFEVDPAARFRLLRALRPADRAMVGHYHSHPDAPAVPSAYDRAMAFEPHLVWLILTVTTDGAGAIAAFRAPMADGDFTPLALRIGEINRDDGDD